MKYEIHGDKVIITDSIKAYIEEKLDKINKYFNKSDELTARVVVIVRGKNQKIEVTIPTKTFTLRGEEENQDLYTAIDLVLERLERQIVKNKTKMLSKAMKNKTKSFVLDEVKDEDEDKEDKIVKRKSIDSKPMCEEEAILQMNMLGHDFFIFKDSKTFLINVLYKRKDGDYGIIESK